MANYRMKFDLHTHTTFKRSNGVEVTHAQGTVEENVLAAIEKGLDAIGISNHGPGHVTYGLEMDCVPAMLGEIEEARRRHPEIKILFGVEANIINKSGNLDVLEEDISRFDYIMAGYHYGIFGESFARGAMVQGANWLYEEIGFAPSLFDMVRLNIGAEGRESGSELLARLNTEMVTAAVIKNRPRAITHPGDKGPFNIADIAKVCAGTGTFLEINNFHRDLTVEGIRTAAQYDVTFIIGSDAHAPEKVGCFEEALERALQAGLDLERIVNIEPVKAAAKADAGAESAAKAKPKEAAEVPEQKSESISKFDAGTEQKPEPGPKLDAGTEQKPEPGPKLDAGTEQKPEPGPKLDAGAEQKLEPEPKLEAGAEQKPEPEPKLEAGAEQKPEPETKLDAGSEQKPEPEPKLGAGAEQKPEPGPKLEAGAEQKPEPRDESKAVTQEEIEQESAAAAQAAGKKDRRYYPIRKDYRQKNMIAVYRSRRGAETKPR